MKNANSQQSDSEAFPRDITFLMQKNFLEQRKVFLWGEVNDDSAKRVTEQFLYQSGKNLGAPSHFISILLEALLLLGWLSTTQ